MILKFRNLSNYQGLVHAITSRRFDADDNFNLADYAGQETENAIANRKRICEYLNIEFDRLTIARQTHDSNVAIVTEENAGTGKFTTDYAIDNTDALITNLPNIPLMMFAADCPLVILYDFERHILGLMHCSWRSIVKGLIENTISIMKKQFDINIKNLLIGIGPAAGKCCYQVDEKFVDTISSASFNLVQYVIRQSSGIMTFDLHGAIVHILSETGILAEHVEILDICTICDMRFFSYRREKRKAGRFALIASLI